LAGGRSFDHEFKLLLVICQEHVDRGRAAARGNDVDPARHNNRGAGKGVNVRARYERAALLVNRRGFLVFDNQDPVVLTLTVTVRLATQAVEDAPWSGVGRDMGRVIDWGKDVVPTRAIICTGTGASSVDYVGRCIGKQLSVNGKLSVN
jgi:hypothetical protein